MLLLQCKGLSCPLSPMSHKNIQCYSFKDPLNHHLFDLTHTDRSKIHLKRYGSNLLKNKENVEKMYKSNTTVNN